MQRISRFIHLKLFEKYQKKIPKKNSKKIRKKFEKEGKISEERKRKEFGKKPKKEKKSKKRKKFRIFLSIFTCLAISLWIPTFSGHSFLYLVRFKIDQTTWLRWLLLNSFEWDLTMYLLVRSGRNPGEKMFGSGGIVSQSKKERIISDKCATGSVICKEKKMNFPDKI